VKKRDNKSLLHLWFSPDQLDCIRASCRVSVALMYIWTSANFLYARSDKKVKVAHTRLPSVKFRCWSRFLAVSLHVTWVINPAVGCHYFPPGLQLPPLQFCCLENRGTMGVNSLPKTVTRQRRSCDLNPCKPFCAWVEHANHSAIEPPTHSSSNRNRANRKP